jgi:hypothetical protein
MYSNVIRWWFLCALTADCIAPTNDLLCKFASGADRDSQYAKCHRYDQSALNILLVNHFIEQLKSSAAGEQSSTESIPILNSYKAGGSMKVLQGSRPNVPLRICADDGTYRTSIRVDSYFRSD